jgi:cysteinyl-tRNA synthetase
MELARSEINKLFKTLNSFIFQLYLNGIVFKEKKVKLSEKFIEIMNNDLNFPGVVTLIYDETKSLPSLLKEKKFKIIEQTINQVILQLSILGIVYNLKLAKYIPDLKK